MSLDIELIVEYLRLAQVLVCRCVCKSWFETIAYVLSQIKKLPENWGGYMNMYGIFSLFPNVSFFHNLGHRSALFDSDVLMRIDKLWIDSPLHSNTIVTLYRLQTCNVKQLTLNLHGIWKSIEVLSSVHFPNLQHIHIITDRLISGEIKPISWNSPKLTNMAFVFCVKMFPPYLKWLPTKHLKELSITNVKNIDTKFSIWLFSLMCFWPSVRLSNIHTLRIFDVVPERLSHITIFIDALKLTSIQHLCIVPCSISLALQILNDTSLHLLETEDQQKNWTSVFSAHGSRLKIVNSR